MAEESKLAAAMASVAEGMVTALTMPVNGLAKAYDVAKPFAEHGAHELAAALNNGSAFVMYPHDQPRKEDPQHGLPEQAMDGHGHER